MKKLLLFLFLSIVLMFAEPLKHTQEEFEYYDTLCNFYHSADKCYELGLIYAKGIAVKQDYQKAFECFKKACEKGSLSKRNGCYSLASLYRNGNGTQRDYQQALKYFSVVCESGDLYGCLRIGDLYYNGGYGLDGDIKKAYEYFKMACDGRVHQTGCDNVEALFEIINGKQSKKTFNKYAKDCDKGNATACYNLAHLYHHGKVVMQNRYKARFYYSRACDLGNQGCDISHGLYLSGY